jgi:peptide deformylase
MSVLPVCTWGQPVLKTRAKKVTEITEEIRFLVRDMIETMQAQKGVGLAANQVGQAIRIFVVEIPQKVGEPIQYTLINPELTYKSKNKEIQEEGCLSFPEIYGPVERPLEVEVQGTDLDLQPVVVRGSGLLARAIQHELDHLDGIVFVARMNIVHRLRLKRQLKVLSEKTKARLSEQETKKY